VRKGWKTAFFSPESLPMQLHYSRITAKLAGKRFNKYSLSRQEVETSIEMFSESFFFINPKEDFTLETILEAARQLVRKKGIKAFVIDAWNKIDHQYEGNEGQYISKALDKIATFCMRYGVHAFIIAHPTKMKKDETGTFVVPTLYDISGSAHFYNKTHNGITVYKRKIEDNTYVTEIYIQKVKFSHWGKEGSVSMTFNYERGGRFIGEFDDQRNYLLPPEKDPSSSWKQAELQIEQVQVKANTNFLNKTKDEYSDYEQFDTADSSDAPF
jgi:twinkle protein